MAALPEPVRDHLGQQLRGVLPVEADKPRFLGDDPVPEAFEPQIEDAIANLTDFKSELQERLAQRGEFVAGLLPQQHAGVPDDLAGLRVATIDTKVAH